MRTRHAPTAVAVWATVLAAGAGWPDASAATAVTATQLVPGPSPGAAERSPAPGAAQRAAGPDAARRAAGSDAAQRAPGPGAAQRVAGSDAAQRAALAQARARAILAEPRFKPTALPRPFRRPLRSLAEWLLRHVEGAPAAVPGGRATFGALAGVVLLALSLLAARTLRRRAPAERRAPPRADKEDAERPDELERAADQAERRGELGQAIRLRFRAGLLRLDAAGSIALRPSLTSGQVARQLESGAFVELASTFDQVAYGGRRPEPPDLEASRTGWKQVLREARAR